MPQPDPDSERELRIARILRPLGKAPLTREQAERAGQLLGVHPSTVYRLRARFLRNPVTSAVKQSRGGRPRGRRLLDGPLEAVVSEVVEAWLPKQRHLAHPVLECYQEVKRRCRNLQLAPPARNTVAQRIEQHRAAELALLAAQPAAEKAPGSFGATWPLEIVQIDHTLADVLIVDRFTRRVIGRPWVSVAIDLATRTVPAPYWKAQWLGESERPCLLHPASNSWVTPGHSRSHPNMRRLLRFISRQRYRAEWFGER